MRRVEEAGLSALRATMGPRRAERLADLYRDRVLPSLEAASYRLDRRGRTSQVRLERLRDAYRGRRCIIIGNGPSIRDTDLSLLRGEVTFALNRGYLLFDRIGGPTTFLVAVNRYVLQQFGDELVGTGSQLFVGWRSRQDLPKAADVTYIRRARRYTFAENVATCGASEGPTVTYLALQLAFHMGFQKVTLIGVDHSFTTKGPANALVTSTGADPNHFAPAYFGPGTKWQLPDLEQSEVVYQLARDRFEADGRTVVDATVGGQLAIFPKADLRSTLS